MNTFPLTIVTPQGVLYRGEVQRLIVRTIAGDIGILAKHIDCIQVLGQGAATLLEANGHYQYAQCLSGFLRIADNQATLISPSFAWAEKN